MDFVNWSRTVRSTPVRWEAPASEAAVADAVRRAGAEGRRVRVVGSGHSWSPTAATDDVMLTLRDLNRVISLDGDRVTIEAGATLHELLDLLARNGRALPIVGSIDAQTVAGITATGTHGSSLTHGNLSSYLRGLRLVDGLGELIELGEDDPRLQGGRVHLGALGAITQVTLATVPAFKLREDLERRPIDEVVANLPDIARSAEYVKVWWLPPSPMALIYRYTRTGAPGEITDAAWALEAFQSNVVFPGLLALGGLVPDLIPLTNRLIDAVRFRAGSRTGRSDRVLSMPMPPVHRETEMAIPLANAGDGLGWIRDWIRDHRARIDFIVEARFVPADPAWMSPAHGRDTCQLGAYAARSPDTDAFFSAFRAAAEQRWAGRPHWGKELDVTPERVTGWYPKAGEFRELVASLDPEGRYRNRMAEQILG